MSTAIVMFEDEGGLHYAFDIAAHPQVQFLAFGQMDFTSSHRGAIPVRGDHRAELRGVHQERRRRQPRRSSG